MYKIYRSGKLDRRVLRSTAICDILSLTEIEFIATSGFIFRKVVSQNAQNMNFGQDLSFLNCLEVPYDSIFSKNVSCNFNFFFPVHRR